MEFVNQIWSKYGTASHLLYSINSIGMTMWFHNPDLYEKYGEINET